MNLISALLAVSRRYAIFLLLGLPAICHAELAPAPVPLQADEAVLKTKDDCGLIVIVGSGEKRATNLKYNEAKYAAMTWGGACIDGLAVGEGVIYPKSDGVEVSNADGSKKRIAVHPEVRGWANFGRHFGYSTMVLDGEINKRFTWEDVTVNVTKVFARPMWSTSDNEIYSGNVRFKKQSVSTFRISCIVLNEQFPECSYKNEQGMKNFPVYGVDVTENFGSNEKPKRVLCPNPRTPQGCEGLWSNYAGPLIEQAKKFVAENEPKAEALKLALSKLPAVAKNEAIKQEAARKVELEQKRQAAMAAATLVAEEKKFQNTLAKGNAGQLFALADKLNSEGQTEKTRDAQRALVSRFPNSPLAASAAQQMASGNRENATSGTINSSLPQSGGMGKPTSIGRPFEDCKAEENSSGLAQKLNQIPSNDLITKLRGIIASLDFLIATYQKCLPDPRAKQNIDSFKASRAESLQNCRQISTVDNCLSSPFEPTATVSPRGTSNSRRGSPNALPDEVCSASGQIGPCPGSGGNSPDCPRGQNMVNGRCLTGVAQ